jgi:hypothetical protein
VSMSMVFIAQSVVIMEPNVHLCDHKKLPLDPLLNQINLVNIAIAVNVFLSSV